MWSRLDTKNKWRLDGWTDGRTERQNVKTKVCSCAPIRKRRNWLMTLTDWTGRRRLSWSACSGREKWGPNRSTCPTAAERRRRFRQRNNFAPPFSLARVFVSSTADTVWARTDCCAAAARRKRRVNEWTNARRRRSWKFSGRSRRGRRRRSLGAAGPEAGNGRDDASTTVRPSGQAAAVTTDTADLRRRATVIAAQLTLADELLA